MSRYNPLPRILCFDDFESPCLTGTIYLYPDDVDALWEALKNHAEMIQALQNTYYGLREFAVKDCNGYILSFGQGGLDPLP